MDAARDRDDGTAHGFFHRTGRFCRSCVQRLPVDGAAITVGGGAVQEELLHATDRVISRLVDLEFVIGEGPGHDGYRTGEAVLEGSLPGPGAVLRWPGFAREAAAAGAGAVFAFPLHLGGPLVGMLYLHRSDPFILGGAELVTALTLAQVGAAAVLTDFADIGTVSADGLWPGRNEIAQATGMIAVQQNVSLEVALAELRGAAYAQNRPITDVAADVIDRRVTFTHPV